MTIKLGELGPDISTIKFLQKIPRHTYNKSEIDHTLPHSGDTSQKIHCATYHETENNTNPSKLPAPKSREYKPFRLKLYPPYSPAIKKNPLLDEVTPIALTPHSSPELIHN